MTLYEAENAYQRIKELQNQILELKMLPSSINTKNTIQKLQQEVDDLVSRYKSRK